MATVIYVAREDIEHGVAYDGVGMKGGCMVWRAFDRAMGHRYKFHVMPRDAYAWREIDKDATLHFVFPDWVVENIARFDHGDKPRPFSFEVDVPEPAAKATVSPS